MVKQGSTGSFETQGTQGGQLGHPRWSPALPAGPALLTSPKTRTAKALFCAMSKGNKPIGAKFQGEFLLDFSNMKEGQWGVLAPACLGPYVQ